MDLVTPLDATSFGVTLEVLGPLYWIIAVAIAAVVSWLPKRRWMKWGVAAAVMAAFAHPVATHVAERNRWLDQSSARLAAAMAHFQRRCKTAGDKVNRVVEDVDGIVWMKWRPVIVDAKQFSEDPYGRDCDGEDCIGILLRASSGGGLDRPEARQYASGYRFVETVDPSDGKRYRYTAVLAFVRQRTRFEREQYMAHGSGKDPGPAVYEFKLERKAIAAFTARYGLTWDDISTPDDREHWVAGGTLKAIDLQTREVVAERTGYLMNTRRGRIEYSNDSWAWARLYAPRCPKRDERTWDFASKRLRPSNGEQQGGSEHGAAAALPDRDRRSRSSAD
jgi:hypothetical protein